jgi:ferredoxin-nitrite reductase
LKYLLDKWGFENFLAEVEKHLGKSMRRFPPDDCEPRPEIVKHGHIGVFPQKQEGLGYVGVSLPVGRMTCAQMRGLADIAERHGSRTIRLTVWQNLIISDVPNEKIDAVQTEISQLGLSTSATHIKAGLIACTGAAGCKFALAHTKQHAAQLGDYLDAKLELDQPINIHLTGCPNSCAQHYIGDIGCIGTKVPAGEDMAEGYHVFVGGGYGAAQAIGREIFRNVVAEELPQVLEKMLRGYLDARKDESETFVDFVKRNETDQLKELFERQVVMS